MSEGVTIIRFSDIIERALESEDVLVALRLALERLRSNVELRLTESTLRYAENVALEYYKDKINKMDKKDVIKGALKKFLEDILRDEYSPCTPSLWLGVLLKTGLYCLAVDAVRDILCAYDDDKDELIIAKVENIWRLKVFPDV